MEDHHFDCIVVGFGGVGSAALRYAALNGWKVLGIDRFGPAHNRGSSHGQTRVFRKSYFEHPDYVPLLKDAYPMWDELNKRHRTAPEVKELLTQCGVLQIGPADGSVINGTLDSARQYDLKIEQFSADAIHKRLPILKVPQGHVGVFEPDGGFLRVELCVAAMIKQALAAGAQIESGVCIDQWNVDNSATVHVTSQQGSWSADRMIVCAGAWTNEILGDLGLPLKLLAKQQHWYQLDRVDQKLVNEFPCVLFEQDDGSCFYGTPELDTLGMKVCEHSGGQPIDAAGQLNQSIDHEQESRVEGFLDQHFHFTKKRLVHHSMCMYTMTPSENFILDTHPDYSQIAYAAGLSGHGFKFAPVLGKRLVDMLDGKSDARFDFLLAPSAA
jgi:monomeric sarcosine oxidase